MFTTTYPVSSDGGSATFQNNIPDPVTSGEELPTFKFELEKSEGRVMGGSYGKEATVTQLRVSKGIAGVSMRMKPGIMRELHWHATAAERGFVTEGLVRTTVIDPAGHSETNDFGPGDLWFFPRGHGHVIKTLGDKPCHFILVFDSGYFSEFGTFSISDWISLADKNLLAKNVGVPASTWSPRGEKIAQAPASKPDVSPSQAPFILYGEIDPADFDNPIKASFAERRPALYGDLAFYRAPYDPAASTERYHVSAVAVQQAPVTGSREADMMVLPVFLHPSGLRRRRRHRISCRRPDRWRGPLHPGHHCSVLGLITFRERHRPIDPTPGGLIVRV